MKKNSLSMAVVAGVAGVAGLAGVANAVNVNPDGLGQVLLYPYYTVNGGNQTLVSVVNTTNQAKAVKVRFLESLNSAEVLDFNLYLSPFDVWTAAVVRTEGGAALFTADTSCTVPNAVGKDWVDGVPGAQSQFLPYEFMLGGNNPDIIGEIGQVRLGGAGGELVDITDAERMRQGHMEVIEMGVLFNETTLRAGEHEDAPLFRPAAWATHAAPGVPNNCAALEQAWTGPTSTANRGRWVALPGRAVNAPSGGLFGGGVIVDVERGRALSYNADAIDGFFSIAGLAPDAAGTQADLHFAPGSVLPNLSQARTGVNADGDAVAVTNIFANGSVVTAEFLATRGVHAVSAALMARYIFNEYNMEAALNAASEWVVTFPTKRLHTRQLVTYNTAVRADWTNANVIGRPDVRPFTDRDETGEPVALRDRYPFDTFGSCETYRFSRWDREEGPYAVAPGLQPPVISPPRPVVPGTPIFPQLCWESNVIAFNQTLTADTATRVLGATPKQGAHGLNIGAAFQNGWARIEFQDPQVTTGFSNYVLSDDTNPIAVIGLPVIGFWAADYLNENVAAGVRANYSQLHKHRAARDGYIVPAADAPAAGTPFNAGAAGVVGWTQS